MMKGCNVNYLIKCFNSTEAVKDIKRSSRPATATSETEQLDITFSIIDTSQYEKKIIPET